MTNITMKQCSQTTAVTIVYLHLLPHGEAEEKIEVTKKLEITFI